MDGALTWNLPSRRLCWRKTNGKFSPLECVEQEVDGRWQFAKCIAAWILAYGGLSANAHGKPEVLALRVIADST